jgi:hypothetical protein
MIPSLRPIPGSVLVALAALIELYAPSPLTAAPTAGVSALAMSLDGNWDCRAAATSSCVCGTSRIGRSIRWRATARPSRRSRSHPIANSP